MVADWQFYGRKKSIRDLKYYLAYDDDPSSRRFAAYVVLGRRGIGKTQLLQELQKLAPNNLPFVMIELPDPEKIPNSGEVSIGLLMDTAIEAGLKNISSMLPKREYYHNDIIWFGKILSIVLRCGAVVVLDEFHHSANRKLGLVSEIKRIIDDSGGVVGDWGKLFPGKVVMMGSHQQNVRKLFGSTEPLYQRADIAIRLYQWTLPTVMEMANKQGLLAEPKKFLTLWTAYGGMPRHWHRYYTGKSHIHLHDIRDINEWRHSLLEIERDILKRDMEERFDTKAYIELPEIHREILLHIGRNKPNGDNLTGLSSIFKNKETRDRALIQMTNSLELIEGNSPFYTEGPIRWRIVDNNTLFQILVFREIVAPKPGTKEEMEPIPDIEVLISRMETLEGGALERMAATWLDAQENVLWSNSNVWRSIKKKNEKGEQITLNMEIDVMASNKKHVPPMVWLGSSKRNPERHNAQKVIAEQDLFLNELGDGEDAKRLREKSVRRRILFSTQFTPEQRIELSGDGFKVIDIHDMARSFDIDPVPVPKPKPAAPEPSYSPEPF